MRARLRQARSECTLAVQMREMNVADVDAIMRIEQCVHTHPWTRGNFTDALKNAYLSRVYEAEGVILGYMVLMPVVDEVQLIDIAVAAEHQRKGLGRRLLDEAMSMARGLNMRRMLLEVRPSNTAALGLYRNVGFCEIGLRRGYYPADNGREDAIVMECKL